MQIMEYLGQYPLNLGLPAALATMAIMAYGVVSGDYREYRAAKH